MKIPKFTYHPNPIETGSIIETTNICCSCGEKKGLECTASMYSEHDLESICPWCVHDGTAAKKFNGEFNDTYQLTDSEVPSDVIDCIAFRTPGFVAWQQPFWVAHCNDACVFRGEATFTEVKEIKGAALESLLKDNGLDRDMWADIAQNYQTPSTSIYRFDCLHCKEKVYTVDLT